MQRKEKQKPLVLGIIFIAGLIILQPGCSDNSDPAGPDTKPSISITSPSAGDTLTGSVNISASASNTNLVRFYCDNVEMSADDTPPFSISWNSATVNDASHTLKVYAEGESGSAEDQIQVFTRNGLSGIIITVLPSSVSVSTGETQQFSAQVSGTTNTGVNWSVDEGNLYGTISTTGLYTAPTMLPSPAKATIRATSVADPSSSNTAVVTITSSGAAPEVIKLCQSSFSSSYEAGELGTEAVDLAAEAVWGASELNGGNLTLTGTLSQSAPGSDVWSYSSNPGSKLILQYSGGPVVEFTFSTFNGYLNGTWEDFTEQHVLDFTVFIQNQTNLRVQSESGFVTSSFSRTAGRTLIPAWTRQWQRILTGTTLYEGEMLTLNITHTGQENGSIEPGWTHLVHDEYYSGSINSASTQITISQNSYMSRLHDSNTGTHVLNGQFTCNSSFKLNGITYKYEDAHAAWAAGSVLNDPGTFNVVIDTNYWNARGTMLRDGQLFGNIQFTGPVVLNAYGGPDLVLHLTTGEDVFLHTLVTYP